jgi:hypothetical protein
MTLLAIHFYLVYPQIMLRGVLNKAPWSARNHSSNSSVITSAHPVVGKRLVGDCWRVRIGLEFGDNMHTHLAAFMLGCKLSIISVS